MAEFTSTRSKHLSANAHEAVFHGLAPDGGLYVPVSFPFLTVDDVLSLSYAETAKHVLRGMLPAFSEEDISLSCDEAYLYHFDTPEVAPLVKVGNSYALELFHGETCAFKDVALSILPRLMTRARKALGKKETILILTATSGDTGSAAMNGFRDVPGTAIITFFPKGGVSEIQRRQMTSMRGQNLTACAAIGNFDDCQSAVKRMFANLKVPEGICLSSANSINIARLAPQITYYYTSYCKLVKEKVIQKGEEVDFIVPTGNFGDILAGYYAKQMGLPVGKLICASNANRVLTDFITTGVYDKRREFQKTISPSMDILISSNLERLLYHAEGGNSERVQSLMHELQENGFYTASPEALQAIQRDFAAYSFDDKATKAEIKRTFEETGYLIDPHTAVGFAANREYKAAFPDRTAIVLSTASPFKFAQSVLEALGEDPSGDAFSMLNRLSSISGVPVPKGIYVLESAHVIHTDETTIPDAPEYVLGKAAILCQA